MGSSARLFSLTMTAATAAALTGCGNGWINSNARKETPSALMLDAQLAYDQQDYTTSAALYEKIVGIDPENAEARTRLAFAYNAQAGLAVFDLVGKMLTYSKSSGAGSGGDGNNAMSSFSGIVGLSTQEKLDLFTALNSKFKSSPSGVDRLNLAATTLADLRATSPKLSYLHAAFTKACKLIPRRILDKVIRESDSPEIKLSQLFELDASCNGGVPDGGPANSGAMFATAIGSLAQAAVLYQIALDPDSNGTINLADDSTSLSTKLTTLQGEISAVTGNDIASFTLMSAKMKELNSTTTSLLDLGKELSGEIVSATAIHFNLLTLLIAEIPGIPSSVQKSIDDAISKFNDSKQALSGVVSPNSPLAKNPKASSTAPAPAAEGKDFLANSDKAAGSMDEAIAKQNSIIDADTSLSTEQKEEKRAELEKNKEDGCANFEMLKIVYNRPDMKKPDSCPN